MGRHHKMYRYLEKYVGTYSVLAHYDKETHDFPRDKSGKIDSSFDDLYIPCNRGGVITHTYDDNILCWECESSTVFNRVLEELNNKRVVISYELFDTGGMIYFNDDDMGVIAKSVKPKTKGRTYQPYSEHTLKK